MSGICGYLTLPAEFLAKIPPEILYGEPMRPKFTAAEPDDENLFFEAAKIVSAAGYGSCQLIGVHFDIGYNRASKLLRRLQAEGILGTEIVDYATGRYELLRPIGFY
jgi:hypothetical protein